MFKIKFISFFLLVLALSISSCVKTEFDEPPAKDPAIFDVDATLAELKAGIVDQFQSFTEDFIIGGIITSSDESGNIFKQIYIEDGTGGAILNIDVNEMHAFLPTGMQIYVNLNGLSIQDDDGVLSIGGGIEDGNFPSVTRISQVVADAAIAKGTRDNTVEPRITTLSDLNDDMLGTLVQFENVQFTNAFAGSTYADAISNPPVSVNTRIEDCSGANLILRNSGFSNFANEPTPTGKGTLTALFSKFGGDYQLFIRDTDDVQFDGPRCGETVSDLEANTTISDLWSMHTEGSFENITEDMIIEGTVISSDETGNFFKVLYIEDNTAAVRLIIDRIDMYQDYPQGRKVFVKLNGLTLGDDSGALSIGGGIEQDNNGNDRLARIGETQAAQFIERGDEGTLSTTTLTIPEISNEHLNKLIRLDDVQFIDGDAGQDFADADNLFALNRTIEDCENTIVLRTSGYADFASGNTPEGRGTAVAILSIFQGTYQLFINYESDLSMTGERCDGTGGGGGNPTGSGDEDVFETFDNIVDEQVVELDGWYNIAEVGSDSERWFGGEYQGTLYAEASAYQSVDAENIIWLITPAIELDEDKVLTFQSNQHHWASDDNGQLSVWISNDFDGDDTESANWQEIDCNLPTANNDWYEWVDSGEIDLNDYFSNGEVFIGFKYEGQAADDVTGFQLDNVVVKAQ